MIPMRIPFILICVVVVFSSDIVNEEDSDEHDVRSVEVTLIDVQNIIRSSLQKCVGDWERIDSLDNIFHNRLLLEYWKIALQIADEWYPESVECLKRVKPLLEKHKKLLVEVEKRSLSDEEDTVVGLDAFLNENQLHELHYLHKHDDSDAVEQALLNNELKKMKRKYWSQKNSNLSGWLGKLLDMYEFTYDKRNLISRMKIGKASKWDVLNEIADQFYHLRKEARTLYKTSIIGEANFNVIRGMYMDTDPIDQIETKFHELVAELPEERQRLLADHYAAFCRKIFRLVHFEPTDLTTWLTSSQKMALGDMIQDPSVDDMKIYDKLLVRGYVIVKFDSDHRFDKSSPYSEPYNQIPPSSAEIRMYEFYKNASGEQKEEANDIIESGCRHFIAHMFGDDNAEELEELRAAGVVSKQYLAARLATHISEVSNVIDRKRAESSLFICSRIYLAYDGSCECNGHSSTCDSLRHNCLNCTGNTYGVQCEMCMESFTGNPLLGSDCFPIEAEETLCTCNNHTDTCDSEGKCQMCLHNTTGDHCERCAAGFYGDATNGTQDDCIRCPCPDGVDCFVNEHNLVQCRECPNGKHGITCEEDGTPENDLQKEIEEVEEKEKVEEEKAEEPTHINEADQPIGNNGTLNDTVNQTIVDSG